MLSSCHPKTVIHSTLAAIALFFLETPSLHAAEFQAITAEKVAASFPYLLFNPILSISSISGDGSVIGGTITQTGVIFDCAAFDCANSAFAWSLVANTRIPLGTTPITSSGFSGNAFPKRVPALSYDGQSALVLSEYRHYESAIHRNEKAELLRNPVQFGEWLWATDMSADASVVVGALNQTNLGVVGEPASQKPFIWGKETGLRSLEGVSPDSGYSSTAVSGDGRVVVLNDQSAGFTPTPASTQSQNALIWSVANGPTELMPLPESEYSTVSDISFDGSLVVGSSRSGNGDVRPTLWINETPTELETLPGYESVIATDISADGQTILGSAGVLWRNGQVYDLQKLLTTQYGLEEELNGWQLHLATAVSADGNTIAGQGIDPEGNSAAWAVVLNVPEPGVFLLLASSFLILMPNCNRWRQNRPNAPNGSQLINVETPDYSACE